MRDFWKVVLIVLGVLLLGAFLGYEAHADTLKPGEELDLHVIACASEADARSILDTQVAKGYDEALKVYHDLQGQKKCAGKDFTATLVRQVAKYENLSFDRLSQDVETWYILEVEAGGAKAYVLSPKGMDNV